MYELTVFPSGLKVATATMPYLKSVSLGIFVKVGSRSESKLESGICHFIEHMLFKGTTHRSVRDIALDIEGNGGTLNAYTSEECTCYEARGPVALFPLMSEVLTDMVLNPIFPPDELERERGVVVEEIKMYKENPGDYVQELAAQAAWGKHALGRSITGTAATLARMDAAVLADFHRKHYFTPGHLMVVAGPLSHAEVCERAQALYGETLFNAPLVPQKEYVREKDGFSPRVTRVRNIGQTHFVLNYRTPGRHEKGRQALRLLSVLFGESMSSRLFQEIREKKGLAYSIYSDLSLYDECGILSITAGVDAERRDEALQTVLAEVARLQHDGCTQAELDQARRYWLGQLTVMLDTTGGRMAWLGDSLMQYGEIITPEQASAEIMAVTCEEVNALAATLFGSETPTLAAVGPRWEPVI